MIELTYLYRILLSLLLSCFIGFEREQQDKNAGLRTIMLISLGTVVFTILPFILLNISKDLGFTFDFSRILSYVIGGVGFLAGIVIISNKKKKVEGITTSACLWAVVSMSMLCGIGEYLLAIIVGIVIYLILKLKYFRIKIIGSKTKRRKSCKIKKKK